MRRAEKNRRLAYAQAQLKLIKPEIKKTFGNNERDPRHREAVKKARKEVLGGRHPSYILLDLQRL